MFWIILGVLVCFGIILSAFLRGYIESFGDFVLMVFGGLIFGFLTIVVGAIASCGYYHFTNHNYEVCDTIDLVATEDMYFKGTDKIAALEVTDDGLEIKTRNTSRSIFEVTNEKPYLEIMKSVVNPVENFFFGEDIKYKYHIPEDALKKMYNIDLN